MCVVDIAVRKQSLSYGYSMQSNECEIVILRNIDTLTYVYYEKFPKRKKFVMESAYNY